MVPTIASNPAVPGSSLDVMINIVLVLGYMIGIIWLFKRRTKNLLDAGIIVTLGVILGLLLPITLMNMRYYIPIGYAEFNYTGNATIQYGDTNVSNYLVKTPVYVENPRIDIYNISMIGGVAFFLITMWKLIEQLIDMFG